MRGSKDMCSSVYWYCFLFSKHATNVCIHVRKDFFFLKKWIISVHESNNMQPLSECMERFRTFPVASEQLQLCVLLFCKLCTVAQICYKLGSKLFCSFLIAAPHRPREWRRRRAEQGPVTAWWYVFFRWQLWWQHGGGDSSSTEGRGHSYKLRQRTMVLHCYVYFSKNKVQLIIPFPFG